MSVSIPLGATPSMRRTPWQVLPLVLVILLSRIQTMPAAPEPPASPEVTAAMQPFLDEHKLAGLDAVIADRTGRVHFRNRLGYSDVEAKKPMRDDNLFWVASMSKMFVGASILMLVDEGKLNLDDPVARFIPALARWMVVAEKDTHHVVLRAPSRPVTLRHLLSHTSGLAGMSELQQTTGSDSTSLKARALSSVTGPLQWEPGERYQYGNQGMNIAARVVEIASGLPYEEFLQKRLFEPLGMSDTTFWPTEAQLTRLAGTYGPNRERTGLARGSIGFLTRPLSNRVRRFPEAGGGLFSTTHDMLQYGLMLANDGVWEGRRYLSHAAMEELRREQTGTTHVNYSLGYHLRHGMFGHDGAYGTDLSVHPETGLVALFMVQCPGPDQWAARDRFLETATRVFATHTPQAAPRSGADDTYFPPPESQGGWRRAETPDQIRSLGGMDPAKLEELRDWLLQSDARPFAAVVIRHGTIVLQVERGNSAVTDARRVASVSKAVCATVLAIASEWSREGRTPRRMAFEDKAFDFIPWAQPLSDPRKASITVGQLLNHTSGICPEATGAPNDGSWEYVLGHTGDPRTARLAFDPGTGCGYSSHGLAHAALVCETVTGQPYDHFAVEALFRPLGIEHWWFQFYDGGPATGRHPSHGLGMPARDLARIAYCLLQDGRWRDRQVIPRWFVQETAAPTHQVTTPELRWKLNPQVFSHGWELPARHDPASGRSGAGIPADARSKPGSGGQLIAFVPSLDLVVTRQTGSSGDWAFEEYLRRACAAVRPVPTTP